MHILQFIYLFLYRWSLRFRPDFLYANSVGINMDTGARVSNLEHYTEIESLRCLSKGVLRPLAFNIIMCLESGLLFYHLFLCYFQAHVNRQCDRAIEILLTRKLFNNQLERIMDTRHTNIMNIRPIMLSERCFGSSCCMIPFV